MQGKMNPHAPIRSLGMIPEIRQYLMEIAENLGARLSSSPENNSEVTQQCEPWSPMSRPVEPVRYQSSLKLRRLIRLNIYELHGPKR
jgi:hypothetical protein